METKFNKQYFIDKVKATKVENWTSGEMGENGCHCMLGHCGVTDEWKHTEESAALCKLLDSTFERNAGDNVSLDNFVMDINDNLFSGGGDKFLKERWLEKLEKIEE